MHAEHHLPHVIRMIAFAYQKEMMVFYNGITAVRKSEFERKGELTRIATKVFEQTVLPVLFHQIPIFDDTMSNGIFHGVT